MNPKITEKEWLEDFKDFISLEGAVAPEEASKNILKKVHTDLNPSAWWVFSKLFGIHIVVGTLSLAICNQFGLSPFHTEFSLSEYFMKFGHSACMFLCGVLFISLTVMLGRMIFTQDEFRVLSKNAALQIFSLSVFSLVAFTAFGAEIALSIGVLWLTGAMLGGFTTVKAIAWRAHLAA